MTGRTNFAAPSNSDLPDGPTQLLALGNHFDALIGETAANAGALPTADLFVGRTVWTLDNWTEYVCTNAGGSGTWVAVYYDSGWQAATLSGSWATVVGAPRYKLRGTEVILDGTIGGGSGAIMTLPTGYRPANTVYFMTAANTGVAQISVSAAGVVTLLGFYAGGTNVLVSLDGIRFPTN